MNHCTIHGVRSQLAVLVIGSTRTYCNNISPGISTAIPVYPSRRLFSCQGDVEVIYILSWIVSLFRRVALSLMVRQKHLMMNRFNHLVSASIPHKTGKSIYLDSLQLSVIIIFGSRLVYGLFSSVSRALSSLIQCK
jgi:hypothetical protein